MGLEHNMPDRLLSHLEELSRNHPDRILRLHGSVGDTPLEILVFRGFSSSTTHPTVADPDCSVLPEGAQINHGEIIRGPLLANAEEIILQKISPECLLEPSLWLAEPG